MELKLFATVFGAIFIAELGDKTQLATLLFASDKDVNKWLIFFASSAALVVCAGLGVLVGSVISQWVSEKTLSYIAGVGFIVIGVLTLYRA